VVFDNLGLKASCCLYASLAATVDTPEPRVLDILGLKLAASCCLDASVETIGTPAPRVFDILGLELALWLLAGDAFRPDCTTVNEGVTLVKVELRVVNLGLGLRLLEPSFDLGTVNDGIVRVREPLSFDRPRRDAATPADSNAPSDSLPTEESRLEFILPEDARLESVLILPADARLISALADGARCLGSAVTDEARMLSALADDVRLLAGAKNCDSLRLSGFEPGGELRCSS
jgi:hypothetical protein